MRYHYSRETRGKGKRLLGLAAFLASADAASAQPLPIEAPLPPALAWSGASERLVAQQGDPWITPAEASAFETSPDYIETRAYVDRLVAESPLLRIERFGRTPQGRELYAVVASRGDGIRRPVLLAQAGIHSGEIDGKDAGLMLLRDIALRGKDHLLDGADFVLVPIFNADGHERSSPYNRPNQRGPRSQGWRTTAQNLNLNRDYLKGDAPEMRAMISFIGRIDPSLYLDLHVTDGIDYQYDITYGFNGWDGRYAQSPAIGRWLDQVLRPSMDAALSRAGHIPGPLIFAVDDRDPAAGISDGAGTPRFSHGYGDFRRVPTILVENHSLKPYRQRVLGTYVLLEESLRLLGAEGAGLHRAIEEDRAARPSVVTLAWRDLENPIREIPWRGIAHEMFESPISGRREIRWLGRAVSGLMPVIGQEPALTVRLPLAWWVPGSRPDLIERLRLHGVVMEPVAEGRAVEVEMVRLVEPSLRPANEGHVPLAFERLERLRRIEAYPAGSVRIPSDQPLALVAAALLEPESPESFLAWGFFPEILQRTEYIEGYAVEPLARRMMEADPSLRREFEALIASDPEFAGSPQRRLAWFYARSAYFDDRFLLYPVGRELAE